MDERSRSKAVSLGLRRAAARGLSALAGLALDLPRVAIERLPLAAMVFLAFGAPLVLVGEQAAQRAGSVGFADIAGVWRAAWALGGLNAPGLEAMLWVQWAALALVVAPLTAVGVWMMASAVRERKKQGGSGVPFVTMQEATAWADQRGIKRLIAPQMSPMGLGEACRRWVGLPGSAWRVFKSDAWAFALYFGTLAEIGVATAVGMVVVAPWCALFIAGTNAIVSSFGRAATHAIAQAGPAAAAASGASAASAHASSQIPVSVVFAWGLAGVAIEALIVFACVAIEKKKNQQAAAPGVQSDWIPFFLAPFRRAKENAVERLAQMGEGDLARWEAKQLGSEADRASQAVASRKTKKDAKRL